MTPDEIQKYNEKNSPETLKRMNWSYYDTESAARIVAEWADARFYELLNLIDVENPTHLHVQQKLRELLGLSHEK